MDKGCDSFELDMIFSQNQLCVLNTIFLSWFFTVFSTCSQHVGSLGWMESDFLEFFSMV